MKIKELATKLTKAVDDYLIALEKLDSNTQSRVNASIKRKAVLDLKEESLNEKEEGLKKERALLEKEKEASNEKQTSLERKEKKLTTKLQRIQNMMDE